MCDGLCRGSLSFPVLALTPYSRSPRNQDSKSFVPLRKTMFFFEKLVLLSLPEPGKPAVKMRPFCGLPPAAARSGLDGWRGSGRFCSCLCSLHAISPPPSSGAAVGGRRFMAAFQGTVRRVGNGFLFSRLCTVPADAPDAFAVGMWETPVLPASSKRSGISMAGALRGVPAVGVAEDSGFIAGWRQGDTSPYESAFCCFACCASIASSSANIACNSFGSSFRGGFLGS